MQARATGFKWDDVRLFLALYREKTLAGAGARLGLDATTIGRRLGAFEEVMGATLFDRTRDGALPTPAAELLVVAAEEAEQSMLRLAHAADGLEATAEGVVRIAALPTFAERVVVPAIARLREKHPGIRVELEPSTVIADLTRREADLAIRSHRSDTGDLVMTRLMTLDYIVVGSAATASRIGTITSWSDASWITWGADRMHVGAAQWLREHAPTIEPVMRTSSMATQIAAVHGGIGVALLPRPILGSEALVPITFADSLRASSRAWPREDLWLVGHRALRNVPRIAVVWDFLLAEVAPFRTAAT